MPAVLSGAKLTGRDSKAKADKMPGTASLMCKSNMEAEGSWQATQGRPYTPCVGGKNMKLY
eukprot:7918837-Prorocentrum_lima.AAC.1